MFFNARWLDPAIGRFAQADSIIPPGVQGYDRYAYVNNNPMRYTDPTGHICREDGHGCDGSSLQKTKIDGENGPRMVDGNSKKESKDYAKRWKEEQEKKKLEDLSGITKDDLVDFLNKTATAAQDIAMLIDIPFAITEGIFIVGECTMAPPEGCATGAFMGQAAFNLTGANAIESALGLGSLVLTGSADLIDDGKWGEATGTSLVTFLAGGLMIDPIGDLVIDRYASGYNHGTFNGIESLMNGAPLFR
jgi:hypothetical protein